MRARAPRTKHFFQNLNLKTKSRHIAARSYGSPAQPLPRRNLHNMSFLLLYDMYHCYIWRWLSRPKRAGLLHNIVALCNTNDTEMATPTVH